MPERAGAATVEPPRPGTLGERHRLVFVGGLHRSGTTPLTRWLAEHPEVSAFRDTGVWEDEGQHLQDLYRPAADHGGPGRFARDPDAHLTESSELVSPRARERLIAAWAPHWDLSRPVLVEKSPPNMIRTRFLQALFPDARFIVVIRHPVAVAYATRKWTRTSIASLIEHWLHAHELLLADAQAVDRLALVHYENLIADPDRELGRVFRFVGLQPIARDWGVKPGLNDAYLRRWGSGRDPLRSLRARRLEQRYGPRLERFGYGLTTR
jgi:Sulfotransferase family